MRAWNNNDDDYRDERFDRQVRWLLWISPLAVVAGMVITHFWH